MSRAGPVSRAGLVCRDLDMSVKRYKNQLRDYMTTGPAWLAHSPVSPDPGIAMPGSCNANGYQPHNAGLKVISANQASPANWASLAHVIRPLSSLKSEQLAMQPSPSSHQESYLGTKCERSLRPEFGHRQYKVETLYSGTLRYLGTLVFCV